MASESHGRLRLALFSFLCRFNCLARRNAPFRSLKCRRLLRGNTEPPLDDWNSQTIEHSKSPIDTRNMSPCPLPSELIDLIAGRLSRERHEFLDQHVQGCAACQTTLDTLDEPHDAYLSAVQELAHLAVRHAIRPLQQEIDQLRSLPAVVQRDLHSSSQVGSPLSADGTLGDFRILRPVGRGGMGIVYEARQISLGRSVALKTLPFAGLLDPRRLQRFQNEARAAASLEHPHIVPVYAVGVDRGVYYYAMRFIDGPNLAEIIDQLHNRIAAASCARKNGNDGDPVELDRRRRAAAARWGWSCSGAPAKRTVRSGDRP